MGVNTLDKLKKKINQIYIMISMLLWTLPIQTYAVTTAKTSDDFMDKFNAFLGEYKVFITAFSGFLLLNAMVNFIYNIVMLSKFADQPQKRSEVIGKLLEACVLLAITGSASLVAVLYFYIFN